MRGSTMRVSVWSRRVAVVLPLVLAAALTSQLPAAAKADGWRAPVPKDDVSIPVVKAPTKAMVATGKAEAVSSAGAAVWPKAGSATVDLPAWSSGALRPGVAAVAPTASMARAGGLPVRVGRAAMVADPRVGQALAPAAGRVTVGVADHSVAARAGVAGMVLSLRRADGFSRAAPVRVEVDYSSFAGAYGGDWASRLRLVALPGCVLSDPGDPDCQSQSVVSSTNNAPAQTVSALVPVGATAVVLGITGASSGDNGDYKATPLSPSATWQVSQQTGDFSWSYPLRMPPALNGPKPSLALSYSSGSVDGRTGATNNQPSWVGDGWELWSGYVSRQYRGCADDTASVGGQAPNNASHKTGDECWATDNATMVLNGHATELVRDDSTGVWRPKDDDGSTVQRISGDSSRSNGDNDNEYWKITTLDGTQYYFGYNKLPGWASGDATTNSVWTVPVFGNHPGEPCHASSFASSYCNQGWRWNLDYVVDTHGNTMAYFYGREHGHYGRDMTGSQRTDYVRGGWIDHILYGMRAGSEYDGTAPMRVSFSVGDRCLANCWTGSPATAVTANWPDTPWDQDCPASPCATDQNAPTFWSAKRLKNVTTQVWNGTAYRNVDSWTLDEEYLNAGTSTGEGTPQWLRGINHTGKAGGTNVSVPAVSFDPGGDPMPNRVDGPSDGRTKLNRFRIQVITTEGGGQTTVSYSPTECTRSALPDPETNTKRCFPSYWAPDGQTPTLDWFHKYVVTQTTTQDSFSGNATQYVYYDYLDTPAWHYNTDEMTPDDHRTWGEYRGYSKVRVRAGLSSGVQTRTDYLYLRGMDGDHLSSGTRHVTVTDSQGDTVTDSDQYQGFLREQITYNGTTGSEVSGSVNDPWSRGPTATRTSTWGTVKAYMTDTGQTRTRTALSAGGTRNTRTTTTFNTDGLPVTVDDAGDTSTTTDDLCTRTSYAVNATLGIRDTASRVETLSVACGTATTPADPATVVSDKRSYYDNATIWGTAPTHGDVVKTDEVASFTGTTPTYVTTGHATFDAYGRILDAYDALDRQTTTAYTPASGGPLTQTAVTNPLGQTTTTISDPAWGLPVTTTDPNGATVQESYDALGQLTGVWLPGRDKTTYPDTPSMKFSYEFHNDGINPTVVTSQSLLPTGNTYRTTTTLYDGFFRARQEQTQATGGGRTLVDTVYDERGNLAWKSDAYFNGDSGPDGTLVTTTGQTQIPSYTKHIYDGANRETDAIFIGNGTERWRTTTTYGGDHTDVTPPAGGTPTSTYTDARGQTVELRQYHAATPIGTYDATHYTYTPARQLAGVIDPAGNAWTYTYDQRGFLTQFSAPDKGTTTNTYDNAGQLTTTTDARNITLSYTYDDLGRKTGEYQGTITGAHQLAAWTYDTLTSANGIGRLTSTTRYIGGATGDAYTTAVTGYDQAGHILGASVTLPTAEGDLAGTYTLTNTYLANGDLDSTTLPAAGDLAAEQVYYDYDDIGESNGMSSDLDFYIFAATYSKTGQLTQRVLANYDNRIFQTNTYDPFTHRLTTELVTPVNQPDAAQYTYTYNNQGDITKIADNNATTTDNQCFTYDYARRLTTAWTPTNGDCTTTPTTASLGGPAPYWTSYTYDVTGNRTTVTQHTTAGDTTATYNYPNPGDPQPHVLNTVATTSPTGNHTDTYTTDAIGDTTTRPGPTGNQTLTWDAEGHLATVTDTTGTTSYLYDADGNRLLQHDPTGTTAYLPGGTELRLSTGTTTPHCTRYYTHLGTTIAVRTATTLTWTTTDAHNTANIQIDNTTGTITRRRTDPFGNPRGTLPTTWAGDKGFVGGTQDTTGLTHLGAREYDPQLGRFISLDPVFESSNPQQMQGYSYANGNPNTWTDPSGKLSARVCLDECGGDADRYAQNYARQHKKKQKKDDIDYPQGGPFEEGLWGPLLGLTQAQIDAMYKVVNEKQAWEILHEFGYGDGIGFEHFYQVDPMTMAIRSTSYMDQVRNAARLDARAGNYHAGSDDWGRMRYDLPTGDEGVGRAALDVWHALKEAVHDTPENRRKLNVSVIGSYRVDYKIVAIDHTTGQALVAFDATNQWDTKSLTRNPHASKPPGGNTGPTSGPFSPVGAEFSWVEPISLY